MNWSWLFKIFYWYHYRNLNTTSNTRQKERNTNHIACLQVSHSTYCQIYQRPQVLPRYCGFLFAWISGTKVYLGNLYCKHRQLYIVIETKRLRKKAKHRQSLILSHQLSIIHHKMILLILGSNWQWLSWIKKNGFTTLWFMSSIYLV